MIKYNQQRKFLHIFFLKPTSKGHKTADNLLTVFNDQINHINFTDRHYLSFHSLVFACCF